MEQQTNTNSYINNIEEKEKKAETLESVFNNVRSNWTERIKALSEQLKVLEDLVPLQYEVYNARQEAVEYYYYVMNVLHKQNKVYKKKVTDLFKYYKENSNVRYSSEANIMIIIEGELYSELYTIKLLDTQIAYMRETIKTIDSIIFGIKNRIDLEKIKTETVGF